MQLYVQAVSTTFNQNVFVNCIDVIYIQYPLITKKLIFYTVVESILSYKCENFDSGLQIQEKAVKFVAKNRELFQDNANYHSFDTRHKNDLHLPSAHLKLFQKGILFSGAKSSATRAERVSP